MKAELGKGLNTVGLHQPGRMAQDSAGHWRAGIRWKAEQGDYIKSEVTRVEVLHRELIGAARYVLSKAKERNLLL